MFSISQKLIFSTVPYRDGPIGHFLRIETSVFDCFSESIDSYEYFAFECRKQ